MKIDVVTIEVDGTVKAEQIEQGIEGGCADLQQRLGGWIDSVSCNDDTVTLWINDHGKIIGMPVNLIGTGLWHTANPRMAGKDVLCGPVVVSGGFDPEGELMSIPLELAKALLSEPGRASFALAARNRET